jgi:hypothetical protein
MLNLPQHYETSTDHTHLGSDLRSGDYRRGRYQRDRRWHPWLRGPSTPRSHKVLPTVNKKAGRPSAPGFWLNRPGDMNRTRLVL